MRNLALFRRVFCSALFLCWAVASLAAVGKPAPNTKEEVLGERASDAKPGKPQIFLPFPPEGQDALDVVSPDGEQAAWMDSRDQKWAVMVNGKRQGSEYDQVKWLVFSPDSGHFAYFGRNGKKWTAVIDGQPGKAEYDDLEYGVGFSKDGQHYAYAAKRAKKWLIIRDGMESSEYDEVGGPSFSPASQRLVYPYRLGSRSWNVSFDGKDIWPDPGVGGALFGFTPRTEKPIVLGVKLKTSRAVTRLFIPIGGDFLNSTFFIGEKAAGPSFAALSQPIIWGENDEHVLYSGSNTNVKLAKRNAALGQVIVDGKPGPEYEAAPQPVVKAFLKGTDLILPTGVRRLESRWYGVSSPTATPDGQHVAYSVRRPEKDYVVIADGRQSPSFEAIPCGPAFGPDGTLWYVGFTGGKLTLVSDGKRLAEWTWENWKDTDHCADFQLWEAGHSTFVIEQGWDLFQDYHPERLHGDLEPPPNAQTGKRQLFVDGKPGKEYDAVSLKVIPPQIAGNEIHIAYVVHGDKGHNGAFTVLDGEEGKTYDAIAAGRRALSPDGTVRYVARRGLKYFRVTQTH